MSSGAAVLILSTPQGSDEGDDSEDHGDDSEDDGVKREGKSSDEYVEVTAQSPEARPAYNCALVQRHTHRAPRPSCVLCAGFHTSSKQFHNSSTSSTTATMLRTCSSGSSLLLPGSSLFHCCWVSSLAPCPFTHPLTPPCAVRVMDD